jgi:hypothetical protein
VGEWATGFRLYRVIAGKGCRGVPRLAEGDKVRREETAQARKETGVQGGEDGK